MVHEHIVLRKARLHGCLPHDGHLVVVGASMIAAHQQLRRRAILVQRDAARDAIRQHVAWASVGMHPAPEHQHAIHVAERRRLVNRHDARAGGRAHMGINREDRHGAESAERQRTQPDSFQPRAHASSSLPSGTNIPRSLGKQN